MRFTALLSRVVRPCALVTLLLVSGWGAAQNWTWRSGGPDGRGNITALVAMPSQPARVCAGTFESGIFQLSSEIGRWFKATATSTTVVSFAIDPSDAEDVLAATDDGLYRSTDGGVSWGGLALGPFSARWAAIDPSNRSVIYSATFNGLWKSTDSGVNWHSIDDSSVMGSRAYAVDLDPQTLAVYVGMDRGVFKSTDGGGTWTNVLGGSKAPATALVVDAVNHSTVYAIAARHVFKSVDAGATWIAAGSGLPDTTNAIAIDPKDRSTLFAASDGVFKSTDGGSHWIPATSFRGSRSRV